jgi:pimeloyl-ACP methyl ester carboxylesterase
VATPAIRRNGTRTPPRRGVRAPHRAYNAGMTEHVILLHGVWMRGLTLLSLARRLRLAGFGVEVFDYPSVFGSVDAACGRVRERMRASNADRVHLVGHSLGGLIALEATRGKHPLPEGSIVCLGPPLRGSAVARGLAGLPGGHWLLGQSRETLTAGVEQWDGSRPVGVIAGSLPYGLGVAVGALAAPHDGTVAVEETQLGGVDDHCTVQSTHTGLVFSAAVAELVTGFLRDGRFAAARA